jgi:hypothetical protein
LDDKQSQLGLNRTEQSPDYFTAKDLMAKFQIARATVDRLPIKSVKVGGCRRWPREFVERYERRLKRGTPS